MTRARAALLSDGRRLHLQDGPIDLVLEAFGSPEAVQAAYAAAMRRFDGLLDELCAELPALRAPARAEGTALTGPVARRMYEAVVEHAAVAPHAAGSEQNGAATDAPGALDGASPSFSRSREKVPEGRMRARPAEPGGGAGASSGRVPTPFGRRPSSGAARHLLPRAGEGKEATGALGGRPQAEDFITPMAAVAGSVADEVLAAMLAGAAAEGGASRREPSPLSRAYVNNGGDIALFLAPGERFRVGLVDRPDRPSLDASSLFARTELSAEDGIGGIATSGWRGRSFSLGIADAVTVLAATAAAADAAATIVANAVDLPGHPAIVRVPARDLAPDSDLGDRLVTRDVGALSDNEIDAALAAGAAVAEGLVGRGLIAGAALHLAGATRIVSGPVAALAAISARGAARAHTRPAGTLEEVGAGPSPGLAGKRTTAARRRAGTARDGMIGNEDAAR